MSIETFFKVTFKGLIDWALTFSFHSNSLITQYDLVSNIEAFCWANFIDNIVKLQFIDLCNA